MISSYMKLTPDQVIKIISLSGTPSEIKQNKKKLVLSEDEYDQLHELHGILFDLNVATNILQGDNVTLSKLVPTINTIRTNLIKHEYTYLADMKENLLSSIETRFSYTRADPIFGVAAILDPNFCLKWLRPDERPGWRQSLVNFIEQEEEITSQIEPLKPIKEASPPKWTVEYKDDVENLEKNNLIHQMIDKYLTLATEFYHNNVKHLEDNSSESSRVIPFVDTLSFWKQHGNELGLISKVARKVLAIPATSAAVERFFSKTGYIMRPHRRRLKDKLATELFFIKANGRLLDLDKVAAK